MKRACASVVLLTFLLLAAGCSPAAETATAPAGSPSPSASFNCDDLDVTEEEWNEHCTITEDEVASPGPADETPLHGDPYVPLGEAIEYTRVYTDSPGTTWSVKLTKAECGLKKIKKSASNPDWDGSDDIPQYIDAKAAKGSDFCILYWDWKNIGKRPDSTIQSGDLMFGDEQWARTSDDEMMSWTFMETNMGVDYSVSVNPRKSTKSADIYTVDEGRVPDAVWFPMETAVDEDYTLMATR